MRRLVLVFAMGFTVASLLIYFFGDSGLVAYRRLEAYRQQLAANVEKLQARKTGLDSELANLRNDPEKILVMARDIGLYQRGDEVVKLEGLARPATSNEIGDLLRLPRVKASRNVIFKVTGIAVSGVLAGFAVVGGRLSRRKGRGA